MSTTPVADWQLRFAGQLSEGERRYCAAMAEAIHAVAKLSLPFVTFVLALSKDIDELLKFDFDVDAALAAGFISMIESRGSAHSPTGIPLSDLESQFLKDAEGLIEFVARNGLSFTLILGTLGHDINAIRAYGDLADAVGRHFVRLKVTGWAKRNEATVGDPEE